MEPRVAVLDDADAIAEVQVATSRVVYRGLMDQALLDALDVSVRANVWREIIKNRAECVFVVESDVGIVGYAHAGESRDAPGTGVGEITSIYVSPAHWRNGLGTKLLCASEQWLTGRGFSGATLWVLEGNASSRLFYEHLGYTNDGTIKEHSNSGLTQVRYCKALARCARGATTGVPGCGINKQ